MNTFERMGGNFCLLLWNGVSYFLESGTSSHIYAQVSEFQDQNVARAIFQWRETKWCRSRRQSVSTSDVRNMGNREAFRACIEFGGSVTSLCIVVWVVSLGCLLAVSNTAMTPCILWSTEHPTMVSLLGLFGQFELKWARSSRCPLCGLIHKITECEWVGTNSPRSPPWIGTKTYKWTS